MKENKKCCEEIKFVISNYNACCGLAADHQVPSSIPNMTNGKHHPWLPILFVHSVSTIISWGNNNVVSFSEKNALLPIIICKNDIL